MTKKVRHKYITSGKQEANKNKIEEHMQQILTTACRGFESCFIIFVNFSEFVFITMIIRYLNPLESVSDADLATDELSKLLSGIV